MASVTVVICTYNRPILLGKCLRSLQEQTVEKRRFTILVVDNYGDPTLPEIVRSLGANYLHEPVAGLSNARNSGAAAAQTDWVFYLDDDALAHPTLLAAFFFAVANSTVEVIGGRFEHFFATSPPRWLRHYYRKPFRATAEPGVVKLQPNQYIIGCIMAARRAILLKYPFREDLGMNATTTAFGEETEWQDRMRKDGLGIYYYDKMAIDHLVRSDKQKISDRINIAYAHGKYVAITTRSTATPQHARPGYMVEVLRVLLLTAPYDIARVLFRPRFYWQNGWISTVGKLAFLKGKYGK